MVVEAAVEAVVEIAEAVVNEETLVEEAGEVEAEAAVGEEAVV